jgi:uncharacterized membrane protein
VDVGSGQLLAARSLPILARFRKSSALYESAAISERTGEWPIPMDRHWAQGPADSLVRGNESIAWRSLPDSDVAVDAEVKFKQASAGRGTLISARIAYSALPGTSGALARFLNKGVNFFLRQDLRRLEAIMESGEIPTTEGQPHGPRDLITGVLRVADPTRPVYPGSSLKDAFTARRRIA